MYWWKSKINSHKETAILAKSLNKNFAKIKTLVKKLHSYEIPLIEKFNTKANKEFENWLKKQIK